MNDGSVLILLLFVVLVLALFWLFVWGPEAKEARAEQERRVAKLRAERQGREAQKRAEQELRDVEDRVARERREAEDRAKRAAERNRLETERDTFLISIRTGAPDFILKARLEFEREYRATGGESLFGQEMSPLVCFGYRVGKTAGRTESQRRTILEYAVAADYDATLPFLPASYRNDWGKPLSMTRFNRIYQHLNNMADLRDGRRSLDVAVSHWRADASWFHSQLRPKVERFRAI